MIYTDRTDKKYECPRGLNAVVEEFPSLQCTMSGCSGDLKSKKRLETYCKSCENYIENAIKRDQEELRRPVGRELKSQ